MSEVARWTRWTRIQISQPFITCSQNFWQFYWLTPCLQVWASFREFSRLRWIGMGLTYPQHLKVSNNIVSWSLTGFKPERGESQGNRYFTVDWRRGPEYFSSFELSNEEKQKIDIIFDKFTTYVEPKSNFRITWYQLQGFRQSEDESVDWFITRFKIQAQKCWFSEAEVEFRLIEQLIIGKRESKVQEVLLKKMTTWSSTRQWALLQKEKPQLMIWNLLSNKVLQLVSVKSTLMLWDKIKTPSVKNM